MVIHQVGPWGSVRVQVDHRATSSVRCWVNGVEEVPRVGLSKQDANELAEDLVEEHSQELLDAHNSVTA